MEDSSLILKYLKKKKWVFDGTEFIFRNPQIVESSLRSEVDCILPVKGQSYTRVKFGDSVQQIVNDIFDMFDIDRHFAFEVEFYVDGKVAKDVFLSNNTKSIIRKKLKEINYFAVSSKPHVAMEVAIFPNFTKKPETSSQDVTFPFFWDVFNITINDVPVKVNPKYYREAKGFLETTILDNDFSTDVADKFYEACEPDFIFQNTNELYVSASGYLRNIDGIDDGNGSFYFNYSPKYFQKIV